MSPVLTNSWLHASTMMAYIRVALRKSRFINSLVEYLKKNEDKKIEKMLNVSILSFIIINLVKKAFWTFMLQQPVTYV